MNRNQRGQRFDQGGAGGRFGNRRLYIKCQDKEKVFVRHDVVEKISILSEFFNDDQKRYEFEVPFTTVIVHAVLDWLMASMCNRQFDVVKNFLPESNLSVVYNSMVAAFYFGLSDLGLSLARRLKDSTCAMTIEEIRMSLHIENDHSPEVEAALYHQIEPFQFDNM